jgi:hypothetical protein
LDVKDHAHDTFLDWHEHDHRPENQATIGHLVHSERFILAPGRASIAVAEGEFASPGQYLMTYWSSETPEVMGADMSALFGELSRAGRCEPADRDFRAVWRDRMELVAAFTATRLSVSPNAAFMAPHAEVTLTLGDLDDASAAWLQWYHAEGVQTVLSDRRVSSAYTLLSPDRTRFAQLHFIATRRKDHSTTAAITASHRRCHDAQPTVDYVATYVAQVWGHPRFYA